MNYEILCQKREQLVEMRKRLPKEALEAYTANGELQLFTEMIASLEEQRLDEYLGIEQSQI